MWPYAVCFAGSCLFTMFASKYKNRNKRVVYIILSILAILLPCLLAAFRDSSIGTDVSVYGDSIFYRSVQMNFGDYITSRDGEYLYLLVVYVCSHTIGTLPFQYFVLQALSIAPIYFAMQRYAENKYAWFGMAVYYLMLFPYSLNLMRQSIAIAILFWAFKYVQQRKLIKYIIAVAIATLFHSTGIVGIVIYPIYILMSVNMNDLSELAWYRKHQKSALIKFAGKYGRLISWIIILLTVVLLTQFSSVIEFMYTYGSENYDYFYNDISTTSSKLPFITEYIVLVIPIFVLYFLSRKYYNKASNDILPLFTFSAMGIILFQAMKISSETYRICLYFHIFLPVFVMKLLYYKTNAKGRLIWMSVFLICLVLFWYNFFVDSLWCEIYPYTSSILGIS